MQFEFDNINRGNEVTIDWKSAGIPKFDRSQMPRWKPEADLIDQYRRDGVVLMRGIFTDWVEKLRQGLQRNMDAPQRYAYPCESTPKGSPGRFFDSYCNWALIPEYSEHVAKSCCASLAGQLMMSDTAQLFHEHAFCKEPGTQQATPWHQDMPYYCVSGTQTVSLYVALDEMPADVAVQFVRGSHRWGRMFHPVAFLDGSNFDSHGNPMERAPDINSQPEDYDIAAWDLKPGDCIAFDFLTLHGTTAGEVKHRRRAISTRWLGDDVVYCERPVETSPPFEDMALRPGDRMREDWFPVLWRR